MPVMTSVIKYKMIEKNVIYIDRPAFISYYRQHKSSKLSEIQCRSKGIPF